MKISIDKIKKIAIFRALQLGDLMCTIPAIRALSLAYPHAEITLIGLPWASWFTERFSKYFSKFIWFPGFPGLPEQPVNGVAFTGFLNQVQQEKFDLVLQMQGNGSVVNPVVSLFNATFTSGFCQEDNYCPNEDFFLKYPNYGSEIERHLLLMEHLEIPLQGKYLEFPLEEQDYQHFSKLNLPIMSKQYICVHPGSRGLSRRWPTEYFAKLADIAAEKGFKVLITGTKEELELAENVKAKMKQGSIIVAGKTSMGAVGILIKNAFALISNCTGVSHIAAALKTPSVVISLHGEPERWSPLNTDIHQVIDWTKAPDFALAENKLLNLFGKIHPISNS